jgi:hypothetical protein
MLRSRTLGLIFVISLFSLVPGKAQAATGTIAVTVAGSTGAIVPGISHLGAARYSIKEVAAALEAETSALGEVMENRQIVALPLNGRNAFALELPAAQTDLERPHPS